MAVKAFSKAVRAFLQRLKVVKAVCSQGAVSAVRSDRLVFY